MKPYLKLSIIIAILSTLSSLHVEAAEQSLSVKVKVRPNLSVRIDNAQYDLGIIAVGSAKVTDTPIIVTNNSSGVKETYSLNLRDPNVWTSGEPGDEAYRLSCQFDSDGLNMSWEPGNHALSTAPIASTETKFRGDQTGENVPYNEDRMLYLKFESPTSTKVEEEQIITITITAELAE